MTEENNILEKKVMEEIKSGRVKLRSRYVFLAEKLGLGSALVLSVILAVLFFNLVLFYLKASGGLGYLSFGSIGVFAFLESFPYFLVITFIIFIVLAAVLIKKSELIYKKPFGYVAMGLILLIFFSGGILTFTNVAQRIENASYRRHPAGAFFRPFLHRDLGGEQRGIMGRVVEVGTDYITVETPFGIKKMDIQNARFPMHESFRPGIFIKAVGDNNDDFFKARDIRPIKEDEAMMIRRGVGEKFGDFIPRMNIR